MKEMAGRDISVGRPAHLAGQAIALPLSYVSQTHPLPLLS